MSDHTVQISDASFEQDVLKATGPVLVDFWAEWCRPCKMIAPVLDDLAAEYAGNSNADPLQERQSGRHQSGRPVPLATRRLHRQRNLSAACIPSIEPSLDCASSFPGAACREGSDAHTEPF